MSNRNPRTFEDFAATNRQFVAELITGGVILVCKILLAPILRRFDLGSEELGSNGLKSMLYHPRNQDIFLLTYDRPCFYNQHNYIFHNMEHQLDSIHNTSSNILIFYNYNLVNVSPSLTIKIFLSQLWAKYIDFIIYEV